MRRPDFDPETLPAHHTVLDRLQCDGILETSGGFSDKSGGAYVIRAASKAEVDRIAHTDPVYTSGSSIITVYEWNVRA